MKEPPAAAFLKMTGAAGRFLGIGRCGVFFALAEKTNRKYEKVY